jgi:hypothetical protein
VIRAVRLAAAVALATLGAGSSVVAQQPTVELSAATFQDSLGAAPVISVAARNLPLGAEPYVVTLEVSTHPAFLTVLHSAASDTTQTLFRLPRPLPERTKVYFRAQVRDRFGIIRAENISSFVTRSYVRIVGPEGPRDIAQPPQPRFVWSASPLTSPPGPWLFDLEVINTASGAVEFSAAGLSDTVFVAPASSPLQANTSYRWRVRARLASQPTLVATASSVGTFVIGSLGRVNLLYHPFPNPFPRGDLAAVCFWFDVAEPTMVDLEIRDGRNRLVRRIIAGESFARGQHGRVQDSLAAPTAPLPTTCNTRITWDGTDSRGRVVPPGAYYVHFRAGRHREVKKIVFTGR